jgi:hypothetical protein
MDAEKPGAPVDAPVPRATTFWPTRDAAALGAINPEAGRHPIPVDPRELAASLRAAEQCWEHFPYYEARFGDRGRRFAHSDDAWLATLPQLDQAQVTREIDWLSRLLSSRGMPTLLLEVQLGMLRDALVRAVPEREPDYQKLIVAADVLRCARWAQISEAETRTLIDEFDSAVGLRWTTRLPRTGAILVAAVADDLAGLSHAVTSLESWMTDAARFPDAWIAAARRIFSRRSTTQIPL